MPEEIELKQVMEAVNELRTSAENLGTDSAEYKAKQEKIEKDLDAFEKKNQEITTQLAEEKKAREAVDTRIQELELEIAKGVQGKGINYKESEEFKSLQKFVTQGKGAMTPDEIKTLRTDIDTAGGYLTQPEFDNVIIKAITEISPMRSVARVRTVGSKQLEMPKRTSIPTAAYEGELETATDSESAYGSETVNAYRITFRTPYSNDLLMDSKFDLESEITGDAAEAFAQREGNRFILGTGAKQPEGFLTNADVTGSASTTINSLAATNVRTVIQGDDLILITGTLKTGYNPVFTFNRTTLSYLRTLKDTNGAYIWQAGVGFNNNIAAAAPNTIAGEPYVVMPDMPDVAAGNYPIAYADFAKGYTIIDRAGTTIIRDDLTGATQALIYLTFRRYNGGQVILPEAIKVLQITA